MNKIYSSEPLTGGFLNVYEGDVFGNDLKIANMARASFDKLKDEFDSSDEKLINYLAKHKHFSPFRHVQVTMHIKWPEFVARQAYKHCVGIEATSEHSIKDHAWNEVSGRYVPVTDFYDPVEWRKQSESAKQGSDGAHADQESCNDFYEIVMGDIESAYLNLLEMGVAKEQARMILPLNQFTTVFWTVSFQALMNFIELRNKPDAQWEIRQYGKAAQEVAEQFFPVATKAWLNRND